MSLPQKTVEPLARDDILSPASSPACPENGLRLVSRMTEGEQSNLIELGDPGACSVIRYGTVL
jgi:hypothetical protein